MQELAKQLNLPVTVFIQDQTDTPLLRFFYPSCEMPLCIHGFLGAGYVLLHKYISNVSIKAITKSGQSLLPSSNNKNIFLSMERGRVLSNLYRF